MAGHSKFKNIMHRKGAQDAKRGKIFTRLVKEIVVACKEGQPDPNFNPRLRTAIANAKAQNLPKDRIEAAIKKGSGEGDQDNYEAIRYEGFGPEGTAIIVETLTDNRNRTAAEVRAAFSKNGGNLGETGSVGFMFDHKGVIQYPKDVASEEAMFEAALEAGAENCEAGDEFHEITCEMEDFSAVRDTLHDTYGDAHNAALAWHAQTLVTVSEDKAGTVLKLLEALEEVDDVQDVFSNVDIDESIVEKLAS